MLDHAKLLHRLNRHKEAEEKLTEWESCLRSRPSAEPSVHDRNVGVARDTAAK